MTKDKKDDEMKLVDTDDITVTESENNLILTFNKRVIQEPGDKITVFCSELVDIAVVEGARELIVKLQMIRFGIQVFNKSEQERDQEEKKGLVRRDGGRTMSAFSFIKQIDTEIEKLTKKD